MPPGSDGRDDRRAQRGQPEAIPAVQRIQVARAATERPASGPDGVRQRHPDGPRWRRPASRPGSRTGWRTALAVRCAARRPAAAGDRDRLARTRRRGDCAPRPRTCCEPSCRLPRPAGRAAARARCAFGRTSRHDPHRNQHGTDTSGGCAACRALVAAAGHQVKCHTDNGFGRSNAAAGNADSLNC